MTKMDPVIPGLLVIPMWTNRTLRLRVIVEGGGTGSEAAVPIAADLSDAYYFD